MESNRPTCAYHPGLNAEAACLTCGNYLCNTCRHLIDDKILCSSCLADSIERAGKHQDETTPDWPDGAWPAVEVAAPRTVPEASPMQPPPAASAPQKVRLPLTVYALLLLQTVATLAVVFALWTNGLFSNVPNPAALWSGVSSLSAPTLDVPDATRVRRGTVVLSGQAVGAELAALSVDGRMVSVTVVREGRFRFESLELGPGNYELSVIAYRKNGPSIESAPIQLHVGSNDGEAVDEPADSSYFHGVGLRAPQLAHLRSPNRSGRTPRNILYGQKRRRIALTFDGGSNADQAIEVLDALRDKGVRSTIFLTGEFIRTYPDVTRRIVAEGHEVGNHTLGHPHLADWVPGRGHITRESTTREFMEHELAETERIFQETSQTRMSRYWRAPFGEVNNQILRWASNAGWDHVGWTRGLDTLDWVADPNDKLFRTGEEIRQRLISFARAGTVARGGIVLMHLGAERENPASAELPAIIDALRAEGYELVTVSTLVGADSGSG